MDRNYIEKHAEELNVEIEDSFKFHCTMCGRCCRNREDILLNPLDLFKLSQHFQLPPKDIVERFCIAYIGDVLKFPVVRLTSIGIDKRCPFLKGNRCSVNSCKPAVCALYPLGRYLPMDKETYKISENIKYILLETVCGDKRQIHTVRNWLTNSGLDPQDQFFIRWTTCLYAISDTLKMLATRITPKTLNKLWDFLFVMLYLNYDIDQEFSPQFNKNMREILTLFFEVTFK